jgi:hypothetical protein
MTILDNIGDDLLRLSGGDIALYQDLTSRYVSALKRDRSEPNQSGEGNAAKSPTRVPDLQYSQVKPLTR